LACRRGDLTGLIVRLPKGMDNDDFSFGFWILDKLNMNMDEGDEEEGMEL